MHLAVSNVVDRKRYEGRVEDDNGSLAAIAEYIPTDALVVFTHTEVFDGYEGQGVASRLVNAALEDVRRNGGRVLPLCPFVKSYIAKHQEFADLVYSSRTRISSGD
ncbi:GNAT family N-acetyltransferase [Motilibacter aurantiacus]|uniref:GNAT family N-acetyltransferase n=1 Tax=Motilibacter aurantiacus TaxID=2714955 RepID=UPI00140AFA8B|nr:GNAT family N-acetyltransferase [Motilibacter aurantiacus]NHC43671.1 N-acetyltransferase [Motilibacter aurantiacus]